MIAPLIILVLGAVVSVSGFANEPRALPSAAPNSASATPLPSLSGAGAALPPPVPQSSPAPEASPVPRTVADYKKFRDPFKEPVIAEVEEHRSDLERYATTDFKVVAIITGPLRMRAMLVGPDSKTHYVAEKMKIGLRDGVITKITTKSVIVREKVVNPLGEVETFNTEISMDQPAMAGGSTQ
jgi:Tfp pilus assembly protein PilP